MVDVERYDNLVASIAYEFSRKFRMVDVGDIRQELWVWFLEHPNKVSTWEALDNKQSVKLIARSLRNAAKDFCQKEKAKAGGYHVSDNYYYNRVTVEEMLPAIFRGDMQAPALKHLGFSNSKKVASEGGNWFAIMADIERCLDKLTVEQRNLIYLRFGDGADNKTFAAELGISEDAARMRINRAMNNLMNLLGGKQPYREKDYTQEEVDAIGHGEVEPDVLETAGEIERQELD